MEMRNTKFWQYLQQAMTERKQTQQIFGSSAGSNGMTGGKRP
ncbi:hypothetical protein OOU_Y34scaffold00668g16 [Pyricularia oryzae Y34]|uniref:Uncharacterized protein n=3 Tax=Pyricularia oryzae TaxID=318829 RepID=A0A4V1C6P6_PYROR|nr:hypothetical protein OOU_Y34scaffold00668g16 [Pyricularia oryzae Y34]QBZ60618.1 hypothetical protein PoMZ_07560 [Pyricularia oryzae]